MINMISAVAVDPFQKNSFAPVEPGENDVYTDLFAALFTFPVAPAPKQEIPVELPESLVSHDFVLSALPAGKTADALDSFFEIAAVEKQKMSAATITQPEVLGAFSENAKGEMEKTSASLVTEAEALSLFFAGVARDEEKTLAVPLAVDQPVVVKQPIDGPATEAEALSMFFANAARDKEKAPVVPLTVDQPVVVNETDGKSPSKPRQYDFFGIDKFKTKPEHGKFIELLGPPETEPWQVKPIEKESGGRLPIRQPADCYLPSIRDEKNGYSPLDLVPVDVFAYPTDIEILELPSPPRPVPHGTDYRAEAEITLEIASDIAPIESAAAVDVEIDATAMELDPIPPVAHEAPPVERVAGTNVQSVSAVAELDPIQLSTQNTLPTVVPPDVEAVSATKQVGPITEFTQDALSIESVVPANVAPVSATEVFAPVSQVERDAAPIKSVVPKYVEELSATTKVDAIPQVTYDALPVESATTFETLPADIAINAAEIAFASSPITPPVVAKAVYVKAPDQPKAAVSLLETFTNNVFTEKRPIKPLRTEFSEFNDLYETSSETLESADEIESAQPAAEFSFGSALGGKIVNERIDGPVLSDAKIKRVILDQVGSQIKELGLSQQEGGDKSVLKIRLKPAELGTVEITLAKNAEGVIEAHFQTDSPQTQSILKESLEQLRQSLENSGVKVGSLDTSCTTFSSGGQEHKGERPHEFPLTETHLSTETFDGNTKSDDEKQSRLVNLRA